MDLNSIAIQFQDPSVAAEQEELYEARKENEVMRTQSLRALVQVQILPH